MSIRIVCDSTFDLPEEESRALGIEILPLYILLGDETYMDDHKNVDSAMLFDYTRRTGTLPKTSAATVNDYMNFFRRILDEGDDIISTGISSKLSTTFSNAVAAREELAAAGYDPKRIRLIDSEHLSTGVAHVLYRIRELIDAGATLDEIEADVNEYKRRISTSFILDTLEFMHMGGRCTGFVYYAANILSLHPHLYMKDGLLVPGKKYRGNYKQKCLKNYFEDNVLSILDRIDKKLIFTTCSSEGEVLDSAAQMVRDLGVFERVLPTVAGATIASHCGPDCIGFLYVLKKDGEA